MGGSNTIVRRLVSVADHAEDRSPYLILAVVCSAMFLDLSNLSAVTIALPTIGSHFNVDQAQLQWTISAYALTFGSFLLVGGRGGDIFGHRRVLLFGSCVFALFTLVCALSPSFIALVVGRAFQGIGAGFTMPSAQAHVAIHFPDPVQKAKALGFWAAAGSMGFIVGLILGGVLTALLSWRWIFWISLILSALVIPAAYFILPRVAAKAVTSPVPRPAELATDGDSGPAEPEKQQLNIFTMAKGWLVRFDMLGVFLSVSGLLLLTYALTSGNISGWGSASIVSTLVISTVLLALFIVNETRASQPLIKLSLFHDLSFNLTLVLAVATYAVRQACTYFLTLQLQSYGKSPLQTAVLFLPIGVSAFIANSVAGRLVPILGARLMFILGWALCIPGVVLFSFITEDSNYWRYTFPGMILYIAGIAAVYITANFIVVSAASKSDQGAVAGVFNVALQVGGSILGLAVLTAMADSINLHYGGKDASIDHISQIGYQSVYYACTALCGIALILSLFAIKVPESMRGSIWKKTDKPEQAPVVVAPPAAATIVETNPEEGAEK